MSADAHGTEDVAQADSVTAQVMRHGNGSYELVLSAVALGLVGFLIDRKVGTVPVFLLSFTLLGFIGAAASIYYRYRHQISVLKQEAADLRATAREGVRS